MLSLNRFVAIGAVTSLLAAPVSSDANKAKPDRDSVSKVLKCDPAAAQNGTAQFPHPYSYPDPVDPGKGSSLDFPFTVARGNTETERMMGELTPIDVEALLAEIKKQITAKYGEHPNWNAFEAMVRKLTAEFNIVLASAKNASPKGKPEAVSEAKKAFAGLIYLIGSAGVMGLARHCFGATLFNIDGAHASML